MADSLLGIIGSSASAVLSGRSSEVHGSCECGSVVFSPATRSSMAAEFAGDVDLQVAVARGSDREEPAELSGR